MADNKLEIILCELGRLAGTIRAYLANEEPKRRPDKPPGVGDWVLIGSYTEPQKILRIEPKRGWDDDQLWIKDGWYYPNRVRGIVRRSDAPLQKGDQVKFGSKEGWVRGLYTFGIAPNLVNFTANRPLQSGDSHGYFKTKDLTLTEPVYPDGEKLSGKEKED